MHFHTVKKSKDCATTLNAEYEVTFTSAPITIPAKAALLHPYERPADLDLENLQKFNDEPHQAREILERKLTDETGEAPYRVLQIFQGVGVGETHMRLRAIKAEIQTGCDGDAGLFQ